jgi:DNA polymerase III subunit alpha
LKLAHSSLFYYNFVEKPELSEKELLSMEKEMLGIYVSGHPLEKIREQIIATTNISSLQMHEIDETNSVSENGEDVMNVNAKERERFTDGQDVKIAGIITSVKKKYTKNNKLMAFVTLEDLYGTAEIIVFESTYLKAQDILIEENIVTIDGRLSIREDEETKIVAKDIKNFGENKKKLLTLDITNINEEQKAKLRGAIKFFTGEQNNIGVVIKIGEELKSCGAIYLTEEILRFFESIVGKENCKI